ncbi:hypothetical protein JMN32_18280 [Fulvivirga sp. 29W222]|uniref:STAS/SEC14 domain-containing protein n=1 Tax=Fulvivirga marina TaxID=2494733 RepID=A0A937G1C2_9BACT|nr:hypothetical protein [Fulvivirga marina]MBL6448268.1 hypothetical protein [Fulvivirga marina]
MMSNLIRLHETENGSFDYDPQIPCIISSGEGLMFIDDFRKFMECSLELIYEKIKENGEFGLLVDTRYMEVIGHNDEVGMGNDWKVKAYEAGLRFVAFILPDNIFTLMNIEEYSLQSGDKGTLIIEHFDDMESARNWLKEVI